MVFENGVKNIQAAAYNGARMVMGIRSSLNQNKNYIANKRSVIGKKKFKGRSLNNRF